LRALLERIGAIAALTRRHLVIIKPTTVPQEIFAVSAPANSQRLRQRRRQPDLALVQTAEMPRYSAMLK
jgi:hypothetical protein